LSQITKKILQLYHYLTTKLNISFRCLTGYW